MRSLTLASLGSLSLTLSAPALSQVQAVADPNSAQDCQSSNFEIQMGTSDLQNAESVRQQKSLDGSETLSATATPDPPTVKKKTVGKAKGSDQAAQVVKAPTAPVCDRP